jgi:hypothetical protein
MSDGDSEGRTKNSGAGIILCGKCRELLDSFVEAVHEVVTLNERHLLAVVEQEPDPHRFDLLIHAANERKQNAKYAYVNHLEMHACSSKHETNRDGT